jgi:long-chain acyl-CoA synthetase
VVRELAVAADPVAAFFAADAAGEPVALATSGSAGRPRSVLRSTQSWRRSFPHVSELAGVHRGSRGWLPGPLAATMNLFAAVHARHEGAALVSSLEDATHAHLTPSVLRRLLDDGAPLSGVTVVVAGDRLAPALHDRAAAAGTRVAHYYGAAELSFVAWGRHADDLTPFPEVEVAVRTGEIWVRSPFLCEGYVGAGGPLRVDEDGFATVADRGRMHADGRLMVTGREGAVTSAGETVRLADVEAVLLTAAVGDAVVLGLRHDRLGAVLAVVLTDPADHGPLLALARSTLSGATRPRLWFHLPDPPRTPAGKVDRAALLALLSGGRSGARRLV